MLVLDSGGLSRLSQRNRRAAALIAALRAEGLLPPVVPTVVLAESAAGTARTDANIKSVLKSCDVDPVVAEATARPGRTTSGTRALAAYADQVVIVAVLSYESMLAV